CNRRKATNCREHGWHRHSHLNDSGMSISKALPTTELSASIACVAAPYLSVVVLCYRSGRSMIPLIERLLCSFALQLHVGTRACRDDCIYRRMISYTLTVCLSYSLVCKFTMLTRNRRSSDAINTSCLIWSQTTGLPMPKS